MWNLKLCQVNLKLCQLIHVVPLYLFIPNLILQAYDAAQLLARLPD